MISRKALLHDVDNYHPLGSRKSVANVPNKPSYVEVDMDAVFASSGNMLMMSRNVYRVHRNNGGRSKLSKFQQLVPALALKFRKRNNLREYQSVEREATGFDNHVDLLKSINTEFMKFCYNSLRWNALVPSRAWGEVGPTDDRKMKKYSEMTAADIPTIDVWQEQETSIMNKQFRNNNKIPFWQTSMHTRHFDRGNDGLKHTPDRASLDNPSRGFKMDPIYDTLDKWTTDDWFGM
jgi:hypothetical protein